VSVTYTYLKMAMVAATAIALSGCSADPGYSDLDSEPTAADAVPADLPDHALDGFDPESVRFVAVLDETRLYLGRGSELPVCLLAYKGATDWIVGCGSHLMTMESRDFEVMIVQDATPNKAGWTRAGENILVKNG
jgi:hypothetical protein